MFCLVFRPFIQITAPYERLGLTSNNGCVNPFHGLWGEPPGRTNSFPALHQDAFGLLALVDHMFIPSQFTVQGDTQEPGGRLHLYYVVVNFQRNGKFPFSLPSEQARSQGGARGSAAPPLKVGAPSKKTKK